MHLDRLSGGIYDAAAFLGDISVYAGLSGNLRLLVLWQGTGQKYDHTVNCRHGNFVVV